jgi:hypothetical protein
LLQKQAQQSTAAAHDNRLTRPVGQGVVFMWQT